MVDDRAGGPHSDDVPDIQTLLRRHRDTTGESYRDIARRTDDQIQHQQIARWLTAGPRSWPRDPRTIEQLARVLRVPVDVVVLAFAKSLGLDVRAASRATKSAVPGADRLTPQQRQVILSVVDAILDASGQERHDGSDVTELRPAARRKTRRSFEES